MHIKENPKSILNDILLTISWKEVANEYFNKSASWFYQRFDNMKVNGKPASFTDEELKQLKEALNDIADRIRIASDKL